MDDVIETVQPSTAAADENLSPDTNDAPRTVRDDVADAFKSLQDEKPEGGETEAKTDETKPGRLAGRDRDERGRVLPKKTDDAAPVAEKPVEQSKPAEAAAPVVEPETPPAAPAVKPPPGWSIQSKAAWDTLPEHIRADIAKRETEVSNGFKQYEGLKPFAERAQSNGQTLHQALTAYTGIEELIRQDIGRGLMHIAHNAGMTQHQAGQMFAQLARNLGAALPQHGMALNGSHAQPDADPILQLLQPIVTPLQQQVQSLESKLTQREQAEQERLTSTAQAVVDEFKADAKYRYFDDLEETIERLFQTGMVERTGDFRRDLATAYDKAARLHPDVHEALINERLVKGKEEQAAKTAAAKRAAVSIKGAPQGAAATGLNGSRGNVRDDVAAAFAALREGA